MAYGFGEIDHICWNIQVNICDGSETYTEPWKLVKILR